MVVEIGRRHGQFVQIGQQRRMAEWVGHNHLRDYKSRDTNAGVSATVRDPALIAFAIHSYHAVSWRGIGRSPFRSRHKIAFSTAALAASGREKSILRDSSASGPCGGFMR